MPLAGAARRMWFDSLKSRILTVWGNMARTDQRIDGHPLKDASGIVKSVDYQARGQERNFLARSISAYILAR